MGDTENRGWLKDLAGMHKAGSVGRRDFFKLAGLMGFGAAAAAAFAGMPASALALTKAEETALDKESPFEVKNLLIDKAEKASAASGGPNYINAGRGNPDFVNTTARLGLAQLTLCAAALAAQRSSQANMGFRVPAKGCAAKMDAWLKANAQAPGAAFLAQALAFAQKELGLDADELCFELIDAAQGDFYPDPPRILPCTEKIVNAYLNKILYGGKPPAGKFSLFSTEGATAAMIYIFESLQVNRILNPGDTIAIVTPIFSPYLEIPALKQYNPKQIHLAGDVNKGWQLPDAEIAKLADPKVKGLFLVNPGNPSSVALDKATVQKVAEVVRRSNPNLIIINDTVYASFTQEFNTLAQEIPENTIGVYSYSKYFGVTGWRLGVVAVYENNVVDKLIAALPSADKQTLGTRYSLSSTDPASIKFIDRLEMDSRDVALAHTGGLSCPQQAAMCLFSLFELMDEKSTYKSEVVGLLTKRWSALYNAMALPVPDGPLLTRYYALIDLAAVATQRHGKAFGQWLQTKWPTGFLIKLAENTATVCLPGEGFAGPEWSLRVALANVKAADCAKVGQNIIQVMDLYHQEYKKQS